MFYIFNKENKCIGNGNIEPSKEDLATRGEYSLELDVIVKLGDTYKDGAVIKPVVIINYEVEARNIRDAIRKMIDKLLLPAATFNDQLITEEQKQILIQDSLLLAQWPSQPNWPYIALPVLSELCQSLITIPSWTYPEQQ